MEPLAALVAAGLGLVAGLASGFFGIGGGVLVVPGVLLLFPGTTFHEAKAASLLAMAIGGAAGVVGHRRAGNVDLRLALAIGAGALVASVASVLLVERVADATLRAGFGLVLVATGSRLLLPRRALAEPPVRDGPAIGFVLGLGAGLLGGAFGVGGGVLVVPVLLALGVGMHVAVGTSLLAVVVVGAAATGAHAWLGYGPVLLALGGPVAIGALAGTPLGAALATRAEAETLRRAFGALLLAVGLGFVASSFAAE